MKTHTTNISKIYVVLNAIVLLSGGYLFFDVHQIVSLGTRISFCLCLSPPFIAVVWYALSIAKRNFWGADADATNEQWLKFPIVIFIISSAFMMWYANPFIRNTDRLVHIIWVAAILAVMVVPLALLWIYDKCGQKFGELFKRVCFCMVGACFLLGAFLSANFVIDTSKPVIAEHRVVSATRSGADSWSFYVTIANDDGNRMRLRTSSTVFWHSRENIGGAIYLVTRHGAFGVTYHRLAVVGDELLDSGSSPE